MEEKIEQKSARCFIAVDFPKEIRNEIARVQKELWKKNIFQGKLTENENLHLTLKFLGEISNERVEEVKKRLHEIKLAKFKAKLGEIGIFKPSFIRIVWIHVAGKELENLQKLIDEKLAGIFPEEERFMSHLTIARVKFVKDRKLFLEELGKIKVRNLEFDVDAFSLLKSELKPEGPVYADLEKFDLQIGNID